jgi:hypothetical protein
LPRQKIITIVRVTFCTIAGYITVFFNFRPTLNLLWILVWLVGMTGFAWTGLNYAVPRFEQKLKAEVQESISAFDSGPVIVSTSGRDVTVSGQVGSEEEKQLLVAAVNFAPGVANVISRLTIVEALPKSAPLTNGQVFPATHRADSYSASRTF